MSEFVGTWSYRSLLRDPDLTKEFNDLRFGAGTLIISVSGSGEVSGSLGGEGWSLGLSGSCRENEIKFQGRGVIGGDEWVYDYLGYMSPQWPNGIDETPAIVGTIVRSVDHSNGQSKAGLVASWYAVQN
ncbi:hypothetical protein [Nitrosomonas ureae]|uniref:Lipocalin-like domain-containing protein n=1 Tax=Nitrosomonas ureae TaxID=44577 RepID=A0A2T5IM13_9PROT|nr:hypothetical protein [Nitrosomonas ureae]PTQ84867.1 hypothetical protein C8R28_101671 [Nitrosomonas ureae]